MSSNAPLLNASVYLRSHASIAGRHVNVGMMTSGGLAPCLSSSVAQLAKYWIEALEEGKISGLTLRMYVDGYAGILTGHSFVVPESEWKNMEKLNFLGGSPIGNSRVKVSVHHKELYLHALTFFGHFATTDCVVGVEVARQVSSSSYF